MDLFKQAELLRPKRLIWKRGQPSRCHQNACALYLEDPEKYKLCTGYYLSGIWRHHSWVLRGKDLLETTHKADKYWGAVLSDYAAVIHCVDSFGEFYVYKKWAPRLHKQLDTLSLAGDKRIFAREHAKIIRLLRSMLAKQMKLSFGYF